MTGPGTYHQLIGNLNREERHIATVLKQNGYSTQDPVDGETEQEGTDMQRPPLVMLPYV